MVYAGIGLPGRIARGLERLLVRDGLANVSEAVGVDNPL
jgi:dihydroorotate dehydrogenase